MKEDFSELVEYLDKKFVKIDNNFIDISSRFLQLEKKLDAKVEKADFNELMTSIDTYAGRQISFFKN